MIESHRNTKSSNNPENIEHRIDARCVLWVLPRLGPKMRCCGSQCRASEPFPSRRGNFSLEWSFDCG